MVTTSPTLRLIVEGSQQLCGDPEQAPLTEIERLRSENIALRWRLAQTTALYVWVEGGSFAKIDIAIREFGYKLDLRNTKDGRDPRIVPL